MRHRNRVILALLLVVGSCDPTPVGAAAPVPVYLQYQHTDSWCVPASAAISLGRMGADADQETLAEQFLTTAQGTSDPEWVVSVMNRYATPLGYSYALDADAANPITLANDLNYDLNGLHQDPVLLAWFDDLPWDSGQSTGDGHALVATAFDPASQQVTVWDPWQPTGGVHTIGLADLAADLQSGDPVLRVSRA